ncbi:MAG TPA: ribonuclease Z [Gemmatimonadaceae bacterium]|nr:ribonuclease Z [Gemmatimonadaceae bacterium]
MRLTTVGTGTAAPSQTRVNAGHLIDAGETRLLMDCGSGVVHRMAALDIDWRTITHLAITHFHYDHILDVPTLFYAWVYGTLPRRSAPLELIGPPGIEQLLEKLGGLIGDDLRTKGFPVAIRELPHGASIEAGALTVEAHKVPHTEESIAYSVRSGNRRVVYSGDTGPDAAFRAWAAHADVLLAECSLPASMAMATHMTPENCAELAAEAAPRTLVLTHFYPPVEAVDIRGIVASQFTGNVVLAADGWFTEIED